MKIAIIGRSEVLFNSIRLLIQSGHNIKAIITAKEAPEYTKTKQDFKIIAEENNIPFLYAPKLGDKKSMLFLKSCEAEIAVSMNYPNVIPQGVIDYFKFGILNAHGGDLPRYRGNACQAWAIINGEKQIGLCIHKMNGGELDSGDIINRDYMTIGHGTKVGICYEWMSNRIPILFVEAVKKLEDNPRYVLEVQSKNPKNALRCYPRRPEDGKIDWSESAEFVCRLINASGSPFSGAYCYYKNRKLIIHNARVYKNDEKYLAVPGQIAFINMTTGSVIVITGRGKIEILNIEVNGKKMPPKNHISGIRHRFT
jgi:methionyl-tRNA formyltransferase